MAKKKTHIDVKVSVESIRDNLRKLIVSAHSQLITDVIIGNLDETELGYEQLFKAMSGVQDRIKYKVGDWVMVKYSSLGSWQFHTDKTKEAGLIQQERIRCQITSINPYVRAAYSVTYQAVDSTDLQREFNYSCYEEWLCPEDEWPGEEKPGDENPF